MNAARNSRNSRFSHISESEVFMVLCFVLFCIFQILAQAADVECLILAVDANVYWITNLVMMLLGVMGIQQDFILA
ncbi:hypothetical protein D3C78_967850 [compost metagenome]